MLSLFQLFANVLCCQWQTLSTKTNEWLNSIFFLNENIGWVVGNSGAMLKTTDGGNSWESKASGVTSRLHSVRFADIKHGWAVGDFGVIIKTHDGGETWILDSSDVIQNLKGFCFYCTFFIDSTTGWVVGGGDLYGGVIIKTTNGGENWTRLYSGTDDNMFSVFFIDHAIGWLTDLQGRILKTTDGGDNWSQQSSGVTSELMSCYFMNSNLGWVVGGGGVILKTSNGGTQWAAQTSGTGSNFNSIFFCNADTGWVVGGSTTLEANITLKTADGGLHWIQQNTNATSRLQSVFFINTNIGWLAGGYGTVLKTNNGGVVSVKEVEISILPNRIVLNQNYPNPFNPSTIISFDLPSEFFVSLKVVDIVGREVSTLVSETLPAGKYERRWDATGLSSSIYFYRLSTGISNDIKRLVVLQ